MNSRHNLLLQIAVITPDCPGSHLQSDGSATIRREIWKFTKFQEKYFSLSDVSKNSFSRYLTKYEISYPPEAAGTCFQKHELKWMSWWEHIKHSDMHCFKFKIMSTKFSFFMFSQSPRVACHRRVSSALNNWMKLLRSPCGLQTIRVSALHNL